MTPRPVTEPPAAPPDAALPGRWMAAAIAASIAALAALFHAAGLAIDVMARGTLHFAMAFAALAATCWGCRRTGGEAARVVHDIAEYVGLFTAVSLIGALASYPVAAFSHGFADATLQRIDTALGFDWIAWYAAVAAHHPLQVLGRAAYAMIYVSPAFLLGHLAIANRRRAAYDFIASVWIAAVITLAAFRFMPAIGPFGYLWHAPIPYVPVSDLWQPDLIPRLRDGSLTTVDPGRLVGLVSAPSFHAAAAVLLIVFAARERGLRGPLIAVNVAMLLATPVEGTHYLIDLILGAGVAGVSLALVAALHRLRRWARPSPPGRSSPAAAPAR